MSHQDMPLPAGGPILLLDRTANIEDTDVLEHFAMDELLCKQTGEGGPAICHLWRHQGSFIMGSRDSRLPAIGPATEALRTSGLDAVVRHSGGAAVPLDLGVVNVSLILPLNQDLRRQDFHRDFLYMVTLIREAVSYACAVTGAEQIAVEAGEIEGAFCPGDYDLSIGGRKFCGIAQRRQRKAFIVQAFVIVEGSGSARARMVRSFYDMAAADADPKHYPLVVPERTASLEELTGIGSGAEATARFIQAVKTIIRSGHAGQELSLAASRLVLPDEGAIKETAAKLRRRYERS